jgi:hypothetical protein
VPADPASWVTHGLGPPDPTGAAPTEVVLSLDGLSQAIGLPLDDPSFGMGVARSVALADARIVTFDGVSGLLAWFEGSAAATLPPIEDDIADLEPGPTVPPATSDDGGPSSAPWIILGLVVALAVVGLVIWVVRRPGDGADSFTPMGTAPTANAPDPADPDPDGGAAEPSAGASPTAPSARAAGVSPDQALAALQRTVEEVTSKLDASVADQAKVKVPGAADAVATPRGSSAERSPIRPGRTAADEPERGRGRSGSVASGTVEAGDPSDEPEGSGSSSR